MRTVDREHIVPVAAKHMDNLRRWLERPNGSFTADRVTLEAVEGGGILVRTQPFGGRDVCVEAERELWGQRAALLSASTMGEAFDRLEELVAKEKELAKTRAELEHTKAQRNLAVDWLEIPAVAAQVWEDEV